MLAAPFLATAAPLLALLLATVRSAVAGQDSAASLADGRPQWRRDDGHADYRRRRRLSVGGGGVHLPRRQWRRPTTAAGQHHDRRQQHFFASTVGPVLGPWRSIHEKLRVQSTWPGTGRYSDETALPATTVRSKPKSPLNFSVTRKFVNSKKNIVSRWFLLKIFQICEQSTGQKTLSDYRFIGIIFSGKLNKNKVRNRKIEINRVYIG